MELFLRLGADVVVPDEFGSAIEIFSRVLQHCHVPEDEIQHFVVETRMEGYEAVQQSHRETVPLREWKSTETDLEIGSYRIWPNSQLKGKMLQEISLRKKYGVTVVLIKRGGQVISEIVPETQLEEGDVVVILGHPKQLALFSLVAKGGS